MKIHIPKHINFAPDSYMYKTFFFLPILYNCFVPSGKALGFSEQRDGKKKNAGLEPQEELGMGIGHNKTETK